MELENVAVETDQSAATSTWFQVRARKDGWMNLWGHDLICRKEEM